nr:ATP-dependent RNA helicase HrpA [Actinomycetota bacterium]
EAISQASANQRAGRAGRTSPGTVIRLYSQEDFNSRPEFTDPEILRTNLASVILQAANLGLGELGKFPFLQAPDNKGIKDGNNLLIELGALAQDEAGQLQLTGVGKQLARLPIEPRFARMLLESARNNVTREVMVIVAGLTIQDPRERPIEKRDKADLLHARFTDPSSDFLTLVNLWNHLEGQQGKLSSSAFRKLCKAEHLNFLRIREWQDLVKQLKLVSKPLGLDYGPARVNPDGIHKSVLAGLLSQLGLLQDQKQKFVNGKPVKQKTSREYLGSNGKKFVVFPGSALAKKPPEALMSAELVETSRLFARMNAAVEPAWAAEIAGDLCKRQISDPHWEKKMGAAIALEKVTLFGLVIISGQKVQYSRIDPMHARELFIRHALVDGEWDSKQSFERENRKLLAELEAEAERARKPELIPDEQDQYRFFNNRIPLDVFSTRSFEGWWRKVREEKPNLLTMTRANLKEVALVAPDENEFPGTWITQGHQFDLQYRFAPGDIEDGVTINIPVEVLPSLDSQEFDWLVPGLRLELVTEMIRALPKAIRKSVVPAADWARKILGELDAKGGFADTLAQTIQAMAGVKVEAADFDLARLPDGLKMTYRVMDQKGKVLATSTSLGDLQSQFKQEGQRAVAQVASKLHRDLERQGLTSWDFEQLKDLVETVSGNSSIKAYPSLVLNGKSVDIEVLATGADRLAKHPRAVAELVRMAIPSPAKYIESHLKQQEKLALAALPYQGIAGFVDDVIAALAIEETRKIQADGLIFSKKQFEAIRDSVQARVLEFCFEIVAIVTEISDAAREAGKAISSAQAMDFLNELSDEKAHIAQLVCKNLVSLTPLDRLKRLPVYLRAITIRVTKMQENPLKDRAAQTELAQALQVFANAGGELPLPSSAAANLVRARWLLEEFRVSLFAQTLGTKDPVSLQRIKKALEI